MTIKRTNKPKAVDLTAMSQAEMAALVGKPTSWLRDRADLPGRNADGSYDAATFIRGIRSDFVAIELPDGDLEPSLQLADKLANCYDYERLAGTLRLLDRIEASHGAPGLAAVATAIRDGCRELLKQMGERAFAVPKTPDQLRAEADQWVVKELRNQDYRAALRVGRIILVCTSCKKYRWGRTWREPPYPPDFATAPYDCPECDQ